jgi:hypothetical protein
LEEEGELDFKEPSEVGDEFKFGVTTRSSGGTFYGKAWSIKFGHFWW